ncbi:MAG: TonB-dependent receptor [Muribaculaceae bacterium]|nr:TonB-dependent receptor [Muribaculaceae bacterium]
MKRQLALLGALFLTCGSVGTIVNAAPAPQVAASSATAIVKGTVVDEKGEPVIGASIQEVGTTRGTTTDVNGKFSLRAGAGAKLQISYIGYKTQNVKATDGMTVKLATDNALLDEVVVVGYGQQKKVNLTGAVSNVDVDKALSSRPVQDIDKALQGAVPGLSVINSSGDIDDNPTMRIRGMGTLSNSGASNPYIIVDGIPMDDISLLNPNDIKSISVLKDASASSIYGARAAFGVIIITTKGGEKGEKVRVRYDNNFAWEQPTYLAKYPTTVTQIEAALEAYKNSNTMNPEVFGQYFEEMLPKAKLWAQQNSGKLGYGEMRKYVDDSNVGDYYVDPVTNHMFFYGDWDVTGIMFKDWAPSQNHNLSVQGSTERTQFYASFGYNDKTGIMAFNPDKRRKYSAVANLTVNVTDWLQAGVRFNYGNKRYQTANTGRYTYQYMWRWGSYFPYGTIDGVDVRNDILYRKQAPMSTFNTYNTRITGFLKANITKEITLNADYTYSVNNFDKTASTAPVFGYNTWSSTFTDPTLLSSSTSVTKDNSKRTNWIFNAYANWAKSFNEAHNLNVMVGANAEGVERQWQTVSRQNLYDVNLPEINLADGTITTNSTHGHNSNCGYFGRINYDYKGIYLLELNGRYDGSSRFPKGDQWAFFPSGSIGYRFTQETYWDKLRAVVSNGKLRASYGEIGNEAVGDDMFVETVTRTADGNVNWLSDAGTKVSQQELAKFVSKSLTWETIRTLNIGIDLGFLNDQFNLTFDWYQRTNANMLAPGKVMPAVLGTGAPYTNAGSLRTRGWELSLSWRKQITKDLGLYANFNIGDSKSVITKWTDDSRLLNTNYSGKNYGDIWGFETDRYFTEADFTGKNEDGSWAYKDGVASQKGLETGNFHYGPGDVKFKDLNGDGKIDGGKGTAEDHGDLKVIGNTLPRYEYSFHVGGTYKGIDLDLFFQGVGKHDVWTQSPFIIPMMNGQVIYDHQLSYNSLDATTGKYNVDQSNEFPRLWPGNAGKGTVTVLDNGCNSFYPQSRYIVHMSYLRLKNITIGYTLPHALTRKAYLEKVRVYFSTTNPITITRGYNAPIDPEVNTDERRDASYQASYSTWGRVTPINRSVSFGVQVTF